MYEPKTYSGLKTVAAILQGLSGLSVIAGIMASVVYMLSSDIIIGGAALVVSIIFSVLLYAASEGVLLAIDIADSSGRTAYLLEQMRIARAERRAAIK